MSKNNPIFKGMELIEIGLKNGDWQSVSDGYWVITHQRILPPSSNKKPSTTSKPKYNNDDVDKPLKAIGSKFDPEIAKKKQEIAAKTVKEYRPPKKRIEDEFDSNDDSKAIRFYKGRRGS